MFGRSAAVNSHIEQAGLDEVRRFGSIAGTNALELPLRGAGVGEADVPSEYRRSDLTLRSGTFVTSPPTARRVLASYQRSIG
jgi:hypothetical protein